MSQPHNFVITLELPHSEVDGLVAVLSRDPSVLEVFPAWGSVLVTLTSSVATFMRAGAILDTAIAAATASDRVRITKWESAVQPVPQFDLIREVIEEHDFFCIHKIVDNDGDVSLIGALWLRAVGPVNCAYPDTEDGRRCYALSALDAAEIDAETCMHDIVASEYFTLSLESLKRLHVASLSGATMTGARYNAQQELDVMAVEFGALVPA